MRHGTNVRFIGCTKEHLLCRECEDPTPQFFLGDKYYVEKVHTHPTHLSVELRGIKGKFNSNCFEEVEKHGDV